jgi:hypothetical protein
VIVVQRETDDWLYKPIYQDGTLYTGSWSYQITAYGARPTGAWLTAVTNTGRKGIDIQGMSKGYYWLWIRIDGQGTYAPVEAPEDLIVE